MLKKAPRKNDAAPRNVLADNPEGTLDRLADGLRRVLATPKSVITSSRQRMPKLKRRA